MKTKPSMKVITVVETTYRQAKKYTESRIFNLSDVCPQSRGCTIHGGVFLTNCYVRKDSLAAAIALEWAARSSEIGSLKTRIPEPCLACNGTVSTTLFLGNCLHDALSTTPQWFIRYVCTVPCACALW